VQRTHDLSAFGSFALARWLFFWHGVRSPGMFESK
jgi:hypothetical protein